MSTSTARAVDLSLDEDFHVQKARELLRVTRAIARAREKLLILERHQATLVKVLSVAADHKMP